MMMSTRPKTGTTPLPTVFPLPENYEGGMGLPDHVELDPDRELTGWVVDDEKRTLTLLYAETELENEDDPKH
jgi:hypothetical protein